MARILLGLGLGGKIFQRQKAWFALPLNGQVLVQTENWRLRVFEEDYETTIARLSAWSSHLLLVQMHAWKWMHKGAQCVESLLSREKLEINAAADPYAVAGAERELV